MKPYIWIPFLLHSIFRKILFFLFKIFIHVKVSGMENLENLARPVIFASNHVSELDGFLIGTALSFFTSFNPIFYVARPKKFYTPGYFGWKSKLYGGIFFKMWGAYPAYSGARDYAQSLRHFIDFLKDKQSVCIFPEGKRSDDGIIKEVHGGVSFLSYDQNIPIVPVYLSGAKKIGTKNFWLRRRHAGVTYGKPIYPTELFGDMTPIIENDRNDFRTAAEKVVERIRQLNGKNN